MPPGVPVAPPDHPTDTAARDAAHGPHDNCSESTACYEWGYGAGWRHALTAYMTPERQASLARWAAERQPAIEKVLALLEWQGDCLLYTGRSNQGGYGAVNEMRDGRRFTLTSHRVVYANLVGEIPPGMYVLHSCDVRLCCNPDHLRIGTHADNMQDRAERGRTFNGRSQRRAGVA